MGGAKIETYYPSKYADKVHKLVDTWGSLSKAEGEIQDGYLTPSSSESESLPTSPSGSTSTPAPTDKQPLLEFPLQVVQESPRDTIAYLFSKRVALVMVTDNLRQRITSVLNECERLRLAGTVAERKAREALLVDLYRNFYKVSSALLMLHHRNSGISDSMGAYENEGYYNQALYPLVDIYNTLTYYSGDEVSDLSEALDELTPVGFFTRGWGGVGITRNGYQIELSPETITQSFSRNSIIELGNYRLLAVRVKNTALYIQQVLPMIQSLSPYHSIVKAINSAVGPTFSYLAWIFYVPRFFINLYFLLKHTIPHPWMNEHEKNIGWRIRLKSEWHKRGFQLMNDGVWFGVGLAACILGAVVTFVGLLPVTAFISILTATLYVFDVINTVFWANKELKKLEKIRGEYIDQIRSEIGNKIPKKKIDELCNYFLSPQVKLEDFNQELERFNFETYFRTYDIKDNKLIGKLNELKEQLMLVNDKIKAREETYHYNLKLALVFMGGMGLVAVGISLSCFFLSIAFPILAVVGIAVVLATAVYQIKKANEKMAGENKPQPFDVKLGFAFMLGAGVVVAGIAFSLPVVIVLGIAIAAIAAIFQVIKIYDTKEENIKKPNTLFFKADPKSPKFRSDLRAEQEERVEKSGTRVEPPPSFLLAPRS